MFVSDHKRRESWRVENLDAIVPRFQRVSSQFTTSRLSWGYCPILETQSDRTGITLCFEVKSVRMLILDHLRCRPPPTMSSLATWMQNPTRWMTSRSQVLLPKNCISLQTLWYGLDAVIRRNWIEHSLLERMPRRCIAARLEAWVGCPI